MADHLDNARQRMENICAILPSSISAADLGVQSNAPFLLLSTRAALTWRTAELARCACDVLAKDDVGAGILLTRAVIESAAYLWRLKEILEDRHKYSPADLHTKIEKMAVGSKNDCKFPQAINILPAYPVRAGRAPLI